MTPYLLQLQTELEEAYSLWFWRYLEEPPKMGKTKNNSALEEAQNNFLAKYRQYQETLKDEGKFPINETHTNQT